MKEILFLGIRCVYTDVEWNIVKPFNVLEFVGNRCDIAQMGENGQLIIFTEKQLAQKYLHTGEGVYYKGHIFFAKDKLQTSLTYQKLKRKLEKKYKTSSQIQEEHLLFLNGVLFKNLKNPSHFAMVQSIIRLYQSNIFSIEILKSKLSMYLKEDTIENVLNEIHKTMKQAG